MAANEFQVSALPADELGRLAVDDAARRLAADPPALVHLTPLASHRGVAQPLAELAEVCRDLGVPLVVDAAQALGHLDCAVGAARDLQLVTQMDGRAQAASACWRFDPELAQRLRPRLPPPEWGLPIPVMQSLELGEANVAARVGYSVALGEHLAAGPARSATGSPQLGRMTRTALADVKGWRVVEPLDEPTAITTLEPTDGADPQRVRAWLIAERGIVTTYAEVQRAPFEMTTPVLRASPHVDTTAEDLDQFAEALAAATAQV